MGIRDGGKALVLSDSSGQIIGVFSSLKLLVDKAGEKMPFVSYSKLSKERAANKTTNEMEFKAINGKEYKIIILTANICK